MAGRRVLRRWKRTRGPQVESVVQGEAIPRPPGRPLIGNLLEVRPHQAMADLSALARQYGPIFALEAPGRVPRLFVSGYDLVDEICDDGRFDKALGPGLAVLARSPVGHGLFTAETADPEWRRAHNVLLPAFRPQALRGYFPRMLDIAMQLRLKWERLNPGDTVDVPADMTRLTLDTIALAGFDYRFNSFYRDTPHPFVVAMLGVLNGAQQSVRQLPALRRMYWRQERRMLADQVHMARIVERLIDERRGSGRLGQVDDLLDRMLVGIDPKSGEGLKDRNIIAQCITFLIAGHETTSGLLSFAIYALLKHPDVLARAYEEVDRVLGRDASVLPKAAQIGAMRYLTQVLEETLRLWPTAPAFTRRARQEVMLGGRYRVTPEMPLLVMVGMLHRDPKVWGEEPERFDPDRFSPERRRLIAPNAYKPFGSGLRACIGRLFALQEAALVLAMVLQRFELVDFADYTLKTKQTLTIKPDQFYIRVKFRT